MLNALMMPPGKLRRASRWEDPYASGNENQRRNRRRIMGEVADRHGTGHLFRSAHRSWGRGYGHLRMPSYVAGYGQLGGGFSRRSPFSVYRRPAHRRSPWSMGMGMGMGVGMGLGMGHYGRHPGMGHYSPRRPWLQRRGYPSPLHRPYSRGSYLDDSFSEADDDPWANYTEYGGYSTAYTPHSYYDLYEDDEDGFLDDEEEDELDEDDYDGWSHGYGYGHHHY